MADDVLAHARLYLALGFAVLPVHFPYERERDAGNVPAPERNAASRPSIPSAAW